MQLTSLNFSFRWIFICISQLDGQVYYFDSYLSNPARDFTDAKDLIDRWLFFHPHNIIWCRPYYSKDFMSFILFRSCIAFGSRGQNAEKISYTSLEHAMFIPVSFASTYTSQWFIYWIIYEVYNFYVLCLSATSSQMDPCYVASMLPIIWIS